MACNPTKWQVNLKMLTLGTTRTTFQIFSALRSLFSDLLKDTQNLRTKWPKSLFSLQSLKWKSSQNQVGCGSCKPQFWTTFHLTAAVCLPRNIQQLSTVLPQTLHFNTSMIHCKTPTVTTCKSHRSPKELRTCVFVSPSLLDSLLPNTT